MLFRSSLGIKRLAETLKADMAVVAEPTKLEIVHAHKGLCRWQLIVPGRSCHSSAPEQGVSAIYRMARIVTAIENYAQVLGSSQRDPLLGPPTMSVGQIEGGTSVNTVPDQCRIDIDRRILPGEEPLEAPGQLTAYLHNEAGIDFPFELSPPYTHKHALSPKKTEELVGRLGKAIDNVKGSHRVEAVPYGTDASTLAEAGIPSVVFGPGDIAKAHTCDEWVSLGDVEQASEILYRFACQD